MKGTLASPAVALASNVLPVPGGPERTAPWQQGCYYYNHCQGLNECIPSRWRTFGILAPRLWYCWGFFKKLTNSRISTLASSQPATSLNRTPVLFFTILALDSLMLKGFPEPLPPRPPINGPRRMVSMINPTSTNVGRMLKKRVLWGKKKCQPSTRVNPKLHLPLRYETSRYRVNFSPVTFAAVVNRHPLCGLQTHLSLGHLKVVFKWVNAANVEPQIALKHGDTTYSCAVYILIFFLNSKQCNTKNWKHSIFAPSFMSCTQRFLFAAALLFCCLYQPFKI